MRSLVGFIKQKQSEVKALFDHYKAAADAAFDARSEARERAPRSTAADERRALTAELAARKNGGATALSRSRRVAAKARDLVKRGDVAEAEALCMEQMEHVHARLAMDAEYRAAYKEGLSRQREERNAARARLAGGRRGGRRRRKSGPSLGLEAETAARDASDARAAEKRAQWPRKPRRRKSARRRRRRS